MAGEIAQYCFMGSGGVCCLGSFIGIIILLCSIVSLNPEEQVVLQGAQGKYVRNGPTTILVAPGRKKVHRKATILERKQYMVIKDIKTGEIRHEAGPKRLFLGAYEEEEAVKTKVTLQKGEYMRLVNALSGYERIITYDESGKNKDGVVPNPFEEAPKGTENAIKMGTHKAVVVLNKSSGVKSLIKASNTGGAFIPKEYQVIEEVREATILKFNEYALVKNLMTGVLRHEAGPKKLLEEVGAYEKVIHVKPKIVLEVNQYIRLLDEKNGKERVEKGQKSLVPDPSEIFPEGPRRATNLDANTSVLVLNIINGQEKLYTKEMLPAGQKIFIPTPEQEIVEERKAIRAGNQEAFVVRDHLSKVHVKNGEQFFLKEYEELVTHSWTDYPDTSIQGNLQIAKKEHRMKIDLVDQRMHFLWQVRTSDNVKIALGGTINWRVEDVEKMIKVTSDPPGDIWHRVRSAVIQAISQTNLEKFRVSYSTITKTAFNTQDQTFYTNRGVKVKTMDITSWRCSDQATQAILQQIIQEKTNRENVISRAKGETEVAAAKLQADIDLEKQRTQYIESLADNKRLEAKMQGEAEGMTLMRAADSFISGLNASVENVTDRVNLYKLHETLKGHNKDLKNLATGKAELYLTPSNVNLRLEMGGQEAATPVAKSSSGDRRLEDAPQADPNAEVSRKLTLADADAAQQAKAELPALAAPAKPRNLLDADSEESTEADSDADASKDDESNPSEL